MNNMLEAEILGEVHKVPVDIGGDLSQDGVLHYRAEDGEVLNVPVDTELDSGSSNLVTNGAVAGAINGLEESKQNKITSDNKLNADLVDDLSATHKFVSAEEKQQIGTNATNISNIQLVIPAEATLNNKLADKGSAVGSIEMSLNSETYVLTLQAKNVNGQNIGSAQSIDLPIESVIVSGSYDSVNKQIILVLQNGNTIEIPVGDLISGLQPEITQNNKLSSDLVDDTNQTNKFVTSAEKSQIATNTNDISAIKDGTNIDSFADVETALAGKQATIDSSHKLDADLIDDTNSTNKMVTANEKQGWSGKQDALTTSSVNDGTIDKVIGFDSNGNIVKGTPQSGGITKDQVIERVDSLPTATETSADFVQIGETLYQKVVNELDSSLIGTLANTKWLIDETPTAPANSISTLVNGVSNGENFATFLLSFYTWNTAGIVMDNINAYGSDDGWSNQAYRIVEFIDGTDIANSDLIDWLQANAKLIQYEYQQIKMEIPLASKTIKGGVYQWIENNVAYIWNINPQEKNLVVETNQDGSQTYKFNTLNYTTEQNLDGSETIIFGGNE